MSQKVEPRRTLVEVLDPSRVGRRAAARNAARLRANKRAQLIIRFPDGESAPLPADVARVVAAMLAEVSAGRPVAVVSESPELTTTAAAALLGCSRPHVVKLIDSGVLPAHMAGTHRRVRLTDLMEYKRMVERRHAILDEMMAENEAMGLYEDEDEGS